MLVHHHGFAGKAFSRCYVALLEEYPQIQTSKLARLETSRVALAWVNLQLSTHALDEARWKRAHGRGQRPSTRDLERCARRQGLADGSYSQALDSLRHRRRDGHAKRARAHAPVC